MELYMLEFINEKKSCTGCTACFNVCPIDCISMAKDEEGFLYPIADDRCIHCNKCKEVCPMFNNKTERQPDIEQYSAAAVSKDINVWEESASGGAFTEICKTFGDENTIVFGATFEGLKVVHSYVVGVENIGIFRKSKYVESDLGDSFSKAETFLKQGKKVIFSGTPCQIAGLRNYLGKEYEDLLCVDLICHGVGSPKVFGEALKSLNEKYGSKIIKYTFRYKKVRMGNCREYLSYYIFEDDKTDYAEMDQYNQLFLSQLCLRSSCQSNCKYRTSNRMGDLTIADFKNKSRVFPKVKDYKNYSTIVVNSKKGDIIFSKLDERMDIIYCDLEDIKRYNPLFYRTTYDNLLRDQFFEDFVKGMGIEELIEKYIPNKNRRRWGLLKDLIPYRCKQWLFKILRK
jgi:coenzyme F420-reducing hydrogenase beta subunit